MSSRSLVPLPFDDSWPVIEAALGRHRNLVLVAEPGAGKTTRFPPMLIDRAIVGPTSQVAVLEPRRLAARAAAMRISSEREWPMKTKVGYSVRFDHQMTESTRLAFFTEGLFLKRLSTNPTLQGIDCVVLDEFHERSRYTDLAIAMLKELQMLERPDLRIVIMSATIHADKIAEFLSIDGAPAEIVRVPGRTFPITVRHASEPLMVSTSREWTERMMKLVKNVLLGPAERLGDVLVFLPGVGEIRRLREALEMDSLVSRGFQILELHGSLTLDEQARVLTPHENDSRPRVILATNIAETSLTINGVGTVVDTGIARVARADRLGFSQLHIERISLASAIQRAGRAGRESAGLAYRAWSKLDENSFQPFDEAELNRIDLSDSLLELYGLGVSDPRTFDWFEKPDAIKMNQALQLLGDLGAIDGSMRLTAMGKRMHQTGASVRAARLLLAARSGEIPFAPTAELETLAAVIAALLTEKDFLLDSQSAASSASHECDLHLRASILIEGNPSYRVDRSAIKTSRRIIESYLSRSSASIEEVIENWNEKAVAALLLKAFPDRVSRRRRAKSPQARMVGGKGVELHPGSSVRESEFFFALKGDAGTSRTSKDPMTTMASSIASEWIEELAPDQVSKRSGVIFDDDTLTAYSEKALMYRDLPMDQGSRDRLDPNDALEILKEAAVARRETLLKAPALARLRTRLRYLQRSNEAITDNVIEASLERAIEEQLYGQSNLKTLFSEAGAEALAEVWEKNAADTNPSLLKDLRDRAPSHFTAPTGNRFRIEYPENQPPFLEVRLQELFGLAVHPTVAGQPLAFHLLGPNYRPVQVTSDIPGFWRGTYFEVRKELRARYPKHSWPENPLEAKPEAKGHRRPR